MYHILPEGVFDPLLTYNHPLDFESLFKFEDDDATVELGMMKA